MQMTAFGLLKMINLQHVQSKVVFEQCDFFKIVFMQSIFFALQIALRVPQGGLCSRVPF